MLAPIVPLSYLDNVVDGMLKGLNQQVQYLTYNIIDSVLRVVLIFFLLPVMGIKGLIIVMFISAILNTSLSLARLIKVTQVRFHPIDWIFKPFLASALPCVLLGFLDDFGIVPITGAWTVVLIVLVVLVYVLLMTLSGAVKKEEIRWLKSLLKK